MQHINFLISRFPDRTLYTFGTSLDEKKLINLLNLIGNTWVFIRLHFVIQINEIYSDVHTFEPFNIITMNTWFLVYVIYGSGIVCGIEKLSDTSILIRQIVA